MNHVITWSKKKVYWVQMSEDALKRTQLARARALQSLRRVA